MNGRETHAESVVSYDPSYSPSRRFSHLPQNDTVGYDLSAFGDSPIHRANRPRPAQKLSVSWPPAKLETDWAVLVDLSAVALFYITVPCVVWPAAFSNWPSAAPPPRL